MEMSGKIVNGKYKIKSRIGRGSFGETYYGENIRNNQKYAIKFENSKVSVPRLFFEVKVYQSMNASENVPKVYSCGVFEDKNFMVMDLLGKSLEELFCMSKRSFGLKTVVLLADRMLKCIEDVHNNDYIHRDIKPDNFVIGSGVNKDKIYIIDFGLSKRYRDKKTGEHIPYREDKQLTGTARYASVNALSGIEQSRRDDLEALGYVWLYFLRGSLPWQGFREQDVRVAYRKILEVKQKTPFEVLCTGFPEQFVSYFYAVRRLKFTEDPNYQELRDIILSILPQNNIDDDNVFEWCKNEKPKVVKITKTVKSPINKMDGIKMRFNDSIKLENKSKTLTRTNDIFDSSIKRNTRSPRNFGATDNFKIIYPYEPVKKEEHRIPKNPSIRIFNRNIDESFELNTAALRRKYLQSRESQKDPCRQSLQRDSRRPKVQPIDILATPRLYAKN